MVGVGADRARLRVGAGRVHWTLVVRWSRSALSVGQSGSGRSQSLQPTAANLPTARELTIHQPIGPASASSNGTASRARSRITSRRPGSDSQVAYRPKLCQSIRYEGVLLWFDATVRISPGEAVFRRPWRQPPRGFGCASLSLPGGGYEQCRSASCAGGDFTASAVVLNGSLYEKCGNYCSRMLQPASHDRVQ